MKPTLQKPAWSGQNWSERLEKAVEKIELLVEPAYCGATLGEIFPPDDRIFKDLALIFFGSDWPNLTEHIKMLTLIYSEKCECKECVFHLMEMA
jgi:hypothetical protein